MIQIPQPANHNPQSGDTSQSRIPNPQSQKHSKFTSYNVHLTNRSAETASTIQNLQASNPVSILPNIDNPQVPNHKARTTMHNAQTAIHIPHCAMHNAQAATRNRQCAMRNPNQLFTINNLSSPNYFHNPQSST